MAYDGSGNYSLPPGSIVSDGTTIDASDHNVPTTDIAAALSQVLLRSGVAPMTGDLDLGGHNAINAGGSGGSYLTTADTGTSGHKIPYLDIPNTWSGGQSFVGDFASHGTSVLGNETTDTVIIKGTTVSSFSSDALGASSAGAFQAKLGLGTAATQNIGTSGANVPLLNAANTWSATQTLVRNTGNSVDYPVSVSRPDAGVSGWYLQGFVSSAGFCGSITTAGPTATGVAYNTTSDDRLKNGQRPLDDSGTIIDQLAPIRFRWNDSDPEDFGFSAQALHQVVPQAVTPGQGNPGDEDFIPWMREKGALEAILVAEIQSLRARVAALEAANGE